MVKFLHSSLLRFAMVAMALTPVGLCYTATPVSAEETAATSSVTATIEPTEGTYESLQSFKITFPGVTSIETVSINSAALAPTLKYVEGGNTYYAMSVTVEGNTMSFSTMSAAAFDGTYTLTVPGALYTLDGVQGADLVFNYKRGQSAEKTVEYTITPTADANGKVSTISPITVTFPNAAKVEENSEFGYSDPYPALTYEGPRGMQAEAVIDTQITSNFINFFVDDADVYSPRDYSFTIPAGYYLVDGVKCPEITKTFSYEVAAQDAYTVLPAAGTVEGLQSFELTFNNATAVATTFSREACPTLYNVGGGYNVATFTYANVDGNKMTLSANSAITTAGSYELRLPAGCYTLDGEAGEAITVAYTIGTSAKTVEYSIAPEADEDGNVSTISPIVVTFTNAAEVKDNPDADYWTQYAKVEYNSPRAGWGDIPAEPQVQSNTVLVFLDSQDQIDGEFRLTIPAGTYLVDGVENPEIEQTFNYVAPVQDPYTVLPAEGTATSLQSFSVTFNRATAVTSAISASTYPTLYNVTAGVQEYAFTSANVEGNTLYLSTKDAFSAAGEYELRIPGASYALDGVAGTEDLVFKYTIRDKKVVLAYSVAPEADKDGNVESISPIVVSFDNATSVTENPNADYYTQYAQVEYNSPKGGWGEVELDGQQAAGNCLIFTLSEQDQISGNFRLTIPAGTYLVDGYENEEIVETFNYVAPSKYTLNPAPGTQSFVLKDFEIAFNGVTEAKYVAATIKAFNLITLTNNETGDATNMMARSGYYSAEGNTLKFQIGYSGVSTPGTYTLHIPGEIFTLDGAAGYDIDEQYIIAEPGELPYTASIEDGAELDSFGSDDIITLTFATDEIALPDDVDDFPEIQVWSDEYNEWLSTTNTWYGVGTDVDEENGKANQLSFALSAWSKDPLAAGKYRVSVPERTVISTDHAYANKAIIINFTIKEQVDKLAYTITPVEANTEYDAVNEDIVITFPNATEVVIDESDYWTYASIQYYDTKWDEWGDAYGFEPAVAEGNKVVFERSSYVSSLEAGEYKVSVPAGLITADGKVLNEEISLTFIIKQGSVEFTTTIDPAEGVVASLKEFNIYFGGGVTYGLNNYTNDTRIYIEDAQGNKTYSSDSFLNYDVEGCPVHLEFTEISEAGEYTLVLPAGSYTVNGVAGDKELTYKYTVTGTDGVQAIFADGVESVDVYNLQGVRVLKNATPAQVRSLNSNVYIVNGKKYLLRK